MSGIGARDPRNQAHAALGYKEQHEIISATKTFERTQMLATKTQVTSASDVVTRKESEAAAKKVAAEEAIKGKPAFTRQQTEFEQAVQPPFLGKNGAWVQNALPILIAPSQTQNLTSTGRLDGTKGLSQYPRPIAAVHTYNDVSPVLTSEYTRDVDRADLAWDNTINKRGLTGEPNSESPPMTMMQTIVAAELTPSHLINTTKDMGDPTIRKRAVDSFWNRQTDGTSLNVNDVGRIGDELSTHAVAGSANSRLVAGKWRYVERPVDGKALYTEYYGPVAGGPATSEYYGRTYHYLPQ